MRDAARQALAFQHQCNLLAVQQLQLDDIQQNVSKGNSLLTSRLLNSSEGDAGTHRARGRRKQHVGQRVMFLRLPRWLANRTWTIASFLSQGSFTVEISSEIWRPFESSALDFVRLGDVAGVRKTLATGELSIWDSTWHPRLGAVNLLEVRTRPRLDTTKAPT